jgi:hypothetical protein
MQMESVRRAISVVCVCASPVKEHARSRTTAAAAIATEAEAAAVLWLQASASSRGYLIPLCVGSCSFLSLTHTTTGGAQQLLLPNSHTLFGLAVNALNIQLEVPLAC